jgi:hypothetical protein
MIKNKNTFFISMILSLIITSNLGISQSAKEALLALKKLEARCQSGISYQDYSPALGEAKFPVNLFLESKGASVNYQLAVSIKTIMEHYEMVQPVWEVKFTNIYHRIYSNDKLGELLVDKYPDVNNIFRDNKIIIHDDTMEFIDADLMLKIIWNAASTELKKATILIDESEAETVAKKKEFENLKRENDSLRSENSKLRIENDSLVKVRVPLKRKK